MFKISQILSDDIAQLVISYVQKRTIKNYGEKLPSLVPS